RKVTEDSKFYESILLLLNKVTSQFFSKSKSQLSCTRAWSVDLEKASQWSPILLVPSPAVDEYRRHQIDTVRRWFSRSQYILNGASNHTYGCRISTVKCASTDVNNGSKKSIVRFDLQTEMIVVHLSTIDVEGVAISVSRDSLDSWS
ncbi:hypothetical protein AKJ16_DCAP26246, partial [Drosera capensis]